MSTSEGHEVTNRLVHFAMNLSEATLPQRAQKECVRAFVNAVGCIIGGLRHEMVHIAREALLAVTGPGGATLVGSGTKEDVLTAALLNGLAGAAYSFDDTYSEAMLHPSVPLVSALLAASERKSTSGAGLLAAFAAGLETACRLTKALTVEPAEAEMAWSQTGIVCGIAAAIATGKLLALNREQLSSAIGLAASEAAGTRATHGSMSASLIYGHAAQTGLRATLLAAKGFTSSSRAIEHRFGFAALHSRRSNLSALTDDLGRHFELMSNTYKPYPCGLVIHPALDGILRLRRDVGFAHQDVAGIELRVARQAIVFGANPQPKDDLQAKVSLHHWVAVAAMTGRAGLAEGRAEMVADPEVKRLRGLVSVTEDPHCASDGATVAVTFRDSARHEVRVDHCIGSLERPMTDDELSEKFLGQVAFVLGSDRAERLLRACWALASLQDVADLTQLTYA